MSENNLGPQGSLPRPGQGSVPRAPKPSVPITGKTSIPRPVLFGVLGVLAAAAVGTVVVFHPGMPKLLPDLHLPSRSAASSSTSPNGAESARDSERAGEVGGGTPAGEGRSAAPSARQRSVTASAHRSAQSSAATNSTRPDPRDPNVASRRVSFRDLDLRTHTGACTALKRIKYAAAEVCPDNDPALGLWHVRQECLADSISRAVQDTHNAQLQALYKQPKGC